jgi:hypothetical protein
MMNRMILRSRVDSDGVVRINVPVGVSEANREVQLTIEPTSEPAQEQSDYITWLNRISGMWQGEFERMPQGELEQREPF